MHGRPPSPGGRGEVDACIGPRRLRAGAMRRLRAHASGAVDAPLAAAMALLRDLEGYPCWYPEGVRAVRVLARGPDGFAQRVEVTLRLGQGPVRRDFELTMTAVAPARGVLALERSPNGPDDPERLTITWQATRSSISIELDALLDVPRLLPVGGVAESLARGLVQAAVRSLSAAPPAAGAGPPRPPRAP